MGELFAKYMTKITQKIDMLSEGWLVLYGTILPAR